ncbi:MAG: hypothetical protein OSJ74_00160 [Clostridia bacterium]|nr:hypothetical protein [Clostridia bacterium]
MNKILFRGFHPDNNGATTITLNGEKIKGVWIYGSLITLGESKYICYAKNCHSIINAGVLSDIVFPETVGQWVRADKDDKDIFKGDIISIHQFLFDGSEHENELIGRVVWDEERVCWAVDHIDHKQIQRYMGYDEDVNFEKVKIPLCELYGLHEESYSKIGNIWEVE